MASSQAPTVTCEKCREGTMQATRIPRATSGLRAIGGLLVFASLAVLGLLALAVVLSTSDTHRDLNRNRDLRVAEDELLSIREVPRDMAEQFGRTGVAHPADLARLPPDARRRAQAIIAAYEAKRPAISAESQFMFGGCVWVGAFAVALPFLVGGALLLRWRQVWRCDRCGYFYDRA